MASPSWADQEKIMEVYKLAAAMSSLDIKYHVDHIVPLVSDFVCGMHVENNLQIIPEAENRKKWNRIWPGQ